MPGRVEKVEIECATCKATFRVIPSHAGRAKYCSKACQNVSHGHTAKGRSSKEYKAWHSMKTRCLNPNCPEYKYYGERGISICKAWIDSFEAFFSDMGKSPDGLYLDRENNDGNYEPGNCRWVTAKVSNNNKRQCTKDITGQRFGRLLVIESTSKRDGCRGVIWHCLCDCGNFKDISGVSLRRGGFDKGTRSCGCLKSDLNKVSRSLKGQEARRLAQGGIQCS